MALKQIVCGGVAATMAFSTGASADCLNFSSTMQRGATGPGLYTTPQGYTLVVTLEEFYDGNGNPVLGPAEMQRVDCQDFDEAYRLNNRAMRVTFAGGPQVDVANFVFCDYGGSENVSSDFDVPPDFSGNLETAVPPYVLDPDGNKVELEVTGAPNANGNAFEGKLAFRGRQQQTILLGGQELFILAVCAN